MINIYFDLPLPQVDCLFCCGSLQQTVEARSQNLYHWTIHLYTHISKAIQQPFVVSQIFVKRIADYPFSMTLYGGKNLNLEISSMIVPESDKLDGLVSSNAATIYKCNLFY